MDEIYDNYYEGYNDCFQDTIRKFLLILDAVDMPEQVKIDLLFEISKMEKY